MPKDRCHIVFLQLPLLDNDVRATPENIPMAATNLDAMLRRSPERHHFDSELPDPAWDRLDDRHLLDAVVSREPDILAVTLYVWNIERSMHVVRRLRKRCPGLRVVGGGPEVAANHPFLWRSGLFDVLVVGEGEPVFVDVLRELRGEERADYRNVARREKGRYRWGRQSPPRLPLLRLLPGPGDASLRPTLGGLAYLETSRGCPSRCAYCAYRRQRAAYDWLPVAEVKRRVEVLRRRGAREIRFIDPTFNAHPRFEAFLGMLADVNRGRELRFFAEVRSDMVTAHQAELLAAANVCEIEVGVQSVDTRVLRAVARPGRPDRVASGIERLSQQGLCLTLDAMCGLPEQTGDDVRETVRRLACVPRAHVQVLHTLLLPGTLLRSRRRALGLRSQVLPPYRVTQTRTMTADELIEIEAEASALVGRSLDCRTRRFVGSRLPDLFPERVAVALQDAAAGMLLPGSANRRAVMLRHSDLFGNLEALRHVIRSAVTTEPHVLWQFVLCAAREEPLDLLDALVGTLDSLPEHFVDRLAVRRAGEHRVSRRVFIKLARGTRYDPSWVDAAEALFERAFY